MALTSLASLIILIFAQVNSSPMPQGWNSPPSGWVAPPTGWVSPPAGWTGSGYTAPATPTNGTVLASGETVIGSGIASSSSASDNVTLSVISYDTSDMGVATYLAPDNDFTAGFGDTEAESYNANVTSDDSYFTLSGEGEEMNTVTLTDVDAGYIATNPAAYSSSSIGNFVASSYAQITDGVGLAPAGGMGSSGWKKEEQV